MMKAPFDHLIAHLRRSSSHNTLLGAAVALLLIFILTQPLRVWAAEELDDVYCLGCHGDESLDSEDGRGMFVQHDGLLGSVHGKLSCLICHEQSGADYEDIPHFTQYQPVDCDACHRVVAATWMEYFYKMLKGKGQEEIPSCKECHGTHTAQKELSMELVCDRCHHKEAEAYCRSFHFQKYPEDPRKYPICTTCHDAHFKSKREVMSEIEYKHETVDICSRCHQRDIETYVHSRHFHELEAGNPKAPVCTSCHAKHEIRKPSDPESQVHTLNISSLCNSCHPGHAESLHRQPGVDPAAISWML